MSSRIGDDLEGGEETEDRFLPAAVLDCRGLYCPLPIVKARKAIAALEPGEILRMIATDPGSVPDMAAFARVTGYRIVDQREAEGEFVFYIRKS